MQVFVRLRLARRAVLLVGALFAVGLLAAGSAGAATYTWNVPLSGKDIIASHLPADPNATGSATITADKPTNRICGTFSWSGISSPVGFGHIHGGQYGQPENPGFTVNLFGPNFDGAPNPVTGCTTLQGAVMDKLDRYSSYFNVVVHTKQYPGGALRGQLGCATLLFYWQCGGF
jgi:hypothetical protein